MKAIFKLIKWIIILAIITLIVLLVTNKTFIYENYKTDGMASNGISIPRFMYLFKEEDKQATFITPLNMDYLNTKKDNYLNNLTKCYNKYYYDKDNDISITNYTITDKEYYRLIDITYSNINYCSSDYILRDMWVYEYSTLSTYVKGDITSDAMMKLISTIYNSKRVDDPKFIDYESKVDIQVECSLNDNNYILEFKDYAKDELAVIKKTKDTEAMAVYKIDNIVNFLNTLERVQE